MTASGKNGVTFSDKVMTYLFDREEVFDKFPTDNMGFALGMYKWHWTQMEEQLKDQQGAAKPEKVNAYKRVSMLKRAIDWKERHPYQKPIIDRLRKRNGEESYLRADVGCECEGGVCLPETCSCMQAGIPCSGTVAREANTCRCNQLQCSNGSPATDWRSRQKRLRLHYTRTFQRLRFQAAEQQGLPSSPARSTAKSAEAAASSAAAVTTTPARKSEERNIQAE